MIRAVAMWLTVLFGAVGATSPQGEVSRFLSDQLGFSAAQLRLLAGREAAVRSFDVADSREVAVGGAVHVRVPPAFFADLLRDVTQFKRGEEILQIGRFSTPPVIGDLAALTVDADDRQALARCRPGHCDVQLPAAAITRFQHQVRWRSASAAADVDRIMRETLLGIVDGYRRQGDAALVAYDDTERPTSPAAEFQAMIAAPPALLLRVPELRRHFAGFPAASPAIDDVFYWSKEKMGPAVVITVTHLAIARVEGRPPLAYVAASKQLYGAHYFDTSLGITFMLTGSGDADMYLAYVNRSRVDVLTGMLGAMKRALLRSRMRGTVAGALEAAQREAERRRAPTRGAN
jgi:hypothetical protein